MLNSMLIMKVTVCWTWAVPKAKPHSAWSKWNSPWRNLPKQWGSPTLVHSTSARKYGRLGFWRRRIGPLSNNRTVWNNFEMDPCTGQWWLQICSRHLRTGCLWNLLVMLKVFGDSGLRCFRRNVQERFRRPGKWEGEATSHPQQIWQCAQAPKWEVTSESCQIQLGWVWFIRCQMATMTWHPAYNSKLHTQMSGTGRSWLISPKWIVAGKNHNVWPRFTNATWPRKKWTKNIWDYMHLGKWWITLYMITFYQPFPF